MHPFIEKVNALAVAIGNSIQLRGFKTGGTVGQVPTKNSNTDFDWSWGTPIGGGGLMSQAQITAAITNKVTFASDNSLQPAGSYITLAGAETLTNKTFSDCTFPTFNQNTTGNAATVTGLSFSTGKTLTVSNSLTLTGTDGSTLNFGTGGTLGTAAFTNSNAYATAAQGTDERVPTAAGLTDKFSTNKAVLVDADEIAIFDSAAADVPKSASLTNIWTWILTKLGALTSLTVGGTWSFAGSARPNSSATGVPASNDLITLSDADKFLGSGCFHPLCSTFSNAGSGQTITSGNNSTYFGWASSPVAGTSYAVGNCTNLPIIATDGVSIFYGMGSGTGGLIDMGSNFVFGFTLLTQSVARDNIIRVSLGRNTSQANSSLGTVTHGFGVRINKKASSSSIYELRLVGSTQNYANDYITAATNASPIVITSAAHNLQNGDQVEVLGCVGNTAANGIFTVSGVTTNNFSLDGSTGNGVWTSGGAVCRITNPIEFTAGNMLKLLFKNTWSTTGTVELRINNMSNEISLSLNRLCPIPRNALNAVVGQQNCLRIGLQSITDATANLSHHIGNIFFMKPST